MNKKKFLATCTLVAFGSTMLPAFALAGSVTQAPTVGTNTPVELTVTGISDIGTGDEVTATKDGQPFEITPTFTTTPTAGVSIAPAAGNWLDGAYVVTYKDSVDNSNDSSGGTDSTDTISFTVAPFVASVDHATISAADLAVSGVTATFESGVTDPSVVVRYDGKDVAFKTVEAYDATDGTVKLTIENATAGNYIIVLQSGNTPVDSVSFEVEAATADQATSAVALGSDGKVAANAQSKAGKAEATLATALTSTLSEYGVYALANQNGTIAKGAKPIENATVDSTIKVTLPGADIAAGYYGVALKADVTADKTVPTAVIQYKDTEKAKADAVVKSINADLEAVKAAIPAILSVNAVNGEADILTAINDIEAVDEAIGASYTITVLGATGDLSSINNGVVNTFGKSPVSGTVRVQIAAANNAAFKTTDDVAVTVTEASALAAVKKAYVANNKMTDYDETADTAKVTLADKGAALSMDAFTFNENNAVVKGAITFTTTDAFVTDYFDLKTGEVTALPEKDYTAKINVNFVDVTDPAAPSIEDTITVTTTIKAAGEKPDDVVAAEKAFIEKANGFFSVSNEAQADGKIDKTELPKLNAAYMELLVAYSNYIDVSNK